MPIRVNNQNALAVYRPQSSVSFQADSSSVDLASGAADRALAQSQQAAQAFAKLGQNIQAALQKREELRDSADYADAVNQMDAAALRFQNEFTDKRKGRDARGAGDVFMSAVKSHAADIAKLYEDRPDLARRVRSYGDALAVKALGAGQSYEDREETEYRKSVLNTGLSRFKAAAGTGTEAEVTVEKAKYLSTLEELDPGMDHGKEKLALDAVEAGAFFDRALADGDYKRAETVLKMRGAALGEHLPAAQLKLRQARKAAEAEARQRRNDAAAQAVGVFNGAVFTAKLTGDPAEVKAQLRDMRKSGLFTARQIQSMERQAQGLEADQLSIAIKEAAADPSVDLGPVAANLEAAALPLKFKENKKLEIAKIERGRAKNELFSMAKATDDSEAKDTAPVWARLEELKGKLSEKDFINFQNALQGIDAKRINGVVKDAEKTLSIAQLQEELKRGENTLPEDYKVALQGKAREISLAADDAAADSYASVPLLKRTVADMDADLQKRNTDGSSYYDAETLRAITLRRKHAAEQLKVLEKAYKDDPAGASLLRLQNGTSPVGPISSTLSQAELDAKIIEDQRANGVTSDKISLLTDKQKSAFNSHWHGANFADKVRMAQGIKDVHGPYAETVLREISHGRRESYADGSPKPVDGTVAETVMAVVDGRASFREAEEFLAAYDLRGKDVMTKEGKSSTDANAVAEDALKEVLKSSNRYQYVIEMADRTMNAQLNTMAKRLADTAKNLLLKGRSPADAARILDHGMKAFHAESVLRENTGEGLGEAVGDETEDGGRTLPGGDWFSDSVVIPFRVTVELPYGVGEAEVSARIADHGWDAFQHYLSQKVDEVLPLGAATGGTASDISSGAVGSGNATASDELNGANGTGGSGDLNATNPEEDAAVQKAVLEDLQGQRAVLRSRLEEQLLKSGWWGNDPHGDPNLLCFFDGTGARIFAIPLRGN